MDSSSALKKSDASLLLLKLYRMIISAHTPESTSFHTDRRLTLIVRCGHVLNCVSKLTLTQRNVGISMACAAGRSCLRSSCAAIPLALTGWCYVEVVSNYVPTVTRSGSVLSRCGVNRCRDCGPPIHARHACTPTMLTRRQCRVAPAPSGSSSPALPQGRCCLPEEAQAY